MCERILSAEALKNPEISKEQKNAGKLRTAAALVGAVLILGGAIVSEWKIVIRRSTNNMSQAIHARQQGNITPRH